MKDAAGTSPRPLGTTAKQLRSQPRSSAARDPRPADRLHPRCSAQSPPDSSTSCSSTAASTSVRTAGASNRSPLKQRKQEWPGFWPGHSSFHNSLLSGRSLRPGLTSQQSNPTAEIAVSKQTLEWVVSPVQQFDDYKKRAKSDPNGFHDSHGQGFKRVRPHGSPPATRCATRSG